MGYVNLIYSASIANANGDGPWTDVSQRGTEWAIHILQTDGSALGSFSIEVSNQQNQPYTYTGRLTPEDMGAGPYAANATLPQYPPSAPPMSITTYTEQQTISGTGTFTISHPPTGVQVFTDGGVIGFTGVPNPPGTIYYAPFQYTVDDAGDYTFDVSNAGQTVTVTYSISTPALGVIIGTKASPGNYIIVDSTNNQALVIAKSDLNVKWVRVRQATPGNTVAFLHTKG